jgi:Holliday junction resolvasome RuvABC endonuclease subunit
MPKAKATTEQLQAALSKLMHVLALKGAAKEGDARAVALTPFQRKRSARKAARARWARAT